MQCAIRFYRHVAIEEIRLGQRAADSLLKYFQDYDEQINNS